jgi:hypothetical protein
MRDDNRLDNELAAFTDQVLAGENLPDVSPELAGLADVVQRLYDTTGPRLAPSASFEAHLTQRLVMEWNHQHPRQGASWLRQRPVRLAALAAAAAVVLVVVGLIFAQDSGGDDRLLGTSLGSVTWGAVIVLGVVLGIAGLVAWYRERR